MNIQYKVKNLGELAAWFEMKAADIRADTKHDNKNLKIAREAKAFAYEQCASMLRKTVIEP